MKVLLLEDDDSKANRVREVIVSAAGGYADICTCNDVATARQNLNAAVFDLIVLDVQVPIRRDEAPEDTAGVELLKELLEDGAHKLPRYVVGVTGIERLYDDCSTVFSAHGWALLPYSPASGEWADALRYFVGHVARHAVAQQQTGATEAPVDVVILTALEQPEFYGLKTAFPELKGPRPLDEKTLLWEAEIPGPKRPLRIAATFAWQMGLTATALLSERLITSLRPSLFAMTGICAGFPDSVRLGDVIVATQSWEWQGGKLVPGKDGTSLQPAPEPYRPSAAVLTALKQCTSLDAVREVISKYFPSDSGSSWTTHFGTLVSGLSVVAAKEKMDEVRLQHRKVIGVEMESYAIYAAARFHPLSPHSIVVKGVCDFGDSSKNDAFQLPAAIRSALLLRALINQGQFAHS